MNYKVAGFQTEDYRVSTDLYEGPLDLLLELIQKAELDITKLALAQVTDQYLEYMHRLKDLEASQVSGFLVIAAKLLQIKSSALLPRMVEHEVGEEDPGEVLAQQLLTYRKFKRAAGWLAQQEEARKRTYLHLEPPIKIEGRSFLIDYSLDDLLNAARIIFNTGADIPIINEVITLQRINIRDKIKHILEFLRDHSRTSFKSLLNQNATRFDVVVTFLAVLELVKRKVIHVQQADLFAEIELELLSDWHPNGEIDLEFEE